MLLSALTLAACSGNKQKSIVILYENDVHCAVEIAYIGITTPSTISSSNPAQFKNEDGLDTELVETATYEKTDATVDAYLAETKGKQND